MAAIFGHVPLTHSAPFRKVQKFSKPLAMTTAHGLSDSFIGKHASFYLYSNIFLCFCVLHLFVLSERSFLHRHHLLLQRERLDTSPQLRSVLILYASPPLPTPPSTTQTLRLDSVTIGYLHPPSCLLRR